MGTRGRKPKPTELKKLAGNPGKRKLNDAEPQFGAAEIRVPRGKLPPEARELWKVLAPQLAQSGVLKATDLPALEVLCLHYAMVRRAWAIVAEKGVTAESTTAAGVVIKKNPAAGVLRENSMAFKGYLTEFGLTPSSRVRIKAEPAEREESLAELLFKGVESD